MNQFELLLPTNFVFGKDAESQAGEQVSRLSTNKKILLVYGSERVKKDGLMKRVTDSLDASGISYMELGGVVPNPRVSLVRKGIEMVRANGLDLVLAVGGGSVIDTAKAIAAGVHFDGDVWALCEGEADIPADVLPIGAVLTIAAAGAESSQFAVISDDETGAKRGFGNDDTRPSFAILNPEVTYSLPAFQTACGACDMMAHILEPYFTISENTTLVDGMIEGLLRGIIAAARVAMETPDDYEARATLMWASTMAMSGLMTAGRDGDIVPHAIGEEMGGRFDMTHGATLSIIIPAWMQYHLTHTEAYLPRFVQYAHNVWGVPIDIAHPQQVAAQGVKRTKDFFRELGLPVAMSESNEAKIDPQKDIPAMVEAVPMDWSGIPGLFFSLDEQGVTDVLNLAR